MKKIIILLFVITTHCSIGQNIPNWTKYDTDSVPYTLHTILSQNNIVVLEFGALWCAPCRLSMPDVQNIWQQYNQGHNGVYCFDMDVSDNETNQQINAVRTSDSLDYPAFSKCSSDYNYYAPLYDAPQEIPFFVLIYPDTANPVNSTVCWHSISSSDSISAVVARIIAHHGCNASGIETINNNNFQPSVYPNPNNGNFVIETNSSEKQTVQIFDVNGKIVLSQIISDKTNINANGLTEGVYNISITNNESIINKRLVIVK